MKKQIDPNLNGFDGEDFLSPPVNESVSDFIISGETAQERRQEPDFKVAEKNEDNQEKDFHASENHRAKAEIGTLNHEYASMRAQNGSSGSHSHSHSGSHHHSSSHHSSSSKKKKKSRIPLPIRIAIVILVILLLFVFTAGGVLIYMTAAHMFMIKIRLLLPLSVLTGRKSASRAMLTAHRVRQIPI